MFVIGSYHFNQRHPCYDDNPDKLNSGSPKVKIFNLYRSVYEIEIMQEWYYNLKSLEKSSSFLAFLYLIPDIIKTIKISKLRWMAEENPVRKLTLLRPEGSRRAGRPKIRWVDGVEEDLRNHSIRGWRRRALDRER